MIREENIVATRNGGSTLANLKRRQDLFWKALGEVSRHLLSGGDLDGPIGTLLERMGEAPTIVHAALY
ncbi:MAG TPA: hypothetical protein VE553_06945, partial [Candidatus Binatia bacterium]|nr:hypothetical protein [Candidatus Binatia bacterium]